MTDPFPIAEAQFMRQLGIHDREDMRSMREELLTENVDWSKIGLRIMLSDSGAQKITQSLKILPVQLAIIGRAAALAGIAMPPHMPTPSKNDAPGGTPAQPAAEKTVRLVVLSRRPLNPHILLCRSPEAPATTTRPLLVRVKSNTNFLPLPSPTGEILAIPLGGDLYEFAGNPASEKNEVPRCPRWPGRW